MKTTLPLAFLAAVAAAALLSLPVSAQTPPTGSSVTLYGTADVYFYRQQLAGTSATNKVDNGAMTTSFFGIAATEDLGGGMVAVADMAGFVSMDTGGSGRSPADTGGFFGKYAWVGISTNNYGSVRLGRQATPTFLNTVRFEPYGGSSSFGTVLHTYVPSGSQPMVTANGTVGANAAGASAGGDSAWNNAISYNSPTVNGFNGLFLYSLGEKAAAPAPGTRMSAAVFYANGPLGLGLSVDRIRDESAVLVRTATDPAGAPYTVNKSGTVLAGASYDFGAVKLFGQLNKSALGVNANPDIKLTTTQLGASSPVGLGKVIVSWLRTVRRQDLVTDRSRNTVSVGYDYQLSKRTDLYTVVMNDRASGVSSGTGFAVGMRHRF